jgi:NADPH-dependent curcumin reductase CurA
MSYQDTEDFDSTLTPEEKAAPTFLEWSDETLARGVRTLAAKLHDSIGFDGITGMAAALALEKIAKDHNAETYKVTIDKGTTITVHLKKP